MSNPLRRVLKNMAKNGVPRRSGIQRGFCDIRVFYSVSPPRNPSTGTVPESKGTLRLLPTPLLLLVLSMLRLLLLLLTLLRLVGCGHLFIDRCSHFILLSTSSCYQLRPGCVSVRLFCFLSTVRLHVVVDHAETVTVAPHVTTIRISFQ